MTMEATSVREEAEEGMIEAHEVLKAVANEKNQAVLSALAVEPSYPRRIAERVGIGETSVARRLKRLEAAGLVEAEWQHIGKNVKIYRLVPEGLQVGFGPQGFRVEILQPGGQARSTRPTVPIETQLPPIDGFVGRRDELEVLSGAKPVVVVDGMPGIGKSALLAAFARACQEDEAIDEVFFHRFRGSESTTWLASRLGTQLAEAGDRHLIEAVETGVPAPDLAELILEAIDASGRVVILDDVHTIEDESLERLIMDAIELTREGKLVLSGRQRLAYNPALDHVQRLHLEGLSDEAVDDYLVAEGHEIDPELLPEIRREVGGHPLALSLFLEACRAPGVEMEDLLDRVPEEDLEAWLLEEIDRTLDDSERSLLAYASLFRDTFTERDLRAIFPKDPTGPMLRLRRRHLIQHTGQAYTLHEVLANAFRTKLDEPEQLHATLARHFLSKATLEDRLEAMHHGLAAGKRAWVLGLLEEDLDLEDFDVIDQGYHNLYLEILDRFDEDDLVDTQQAALIHDEKGDIRYHKGEHEAALEHHARAAELFAELEDQARLADLAWKRALSLEALGREEEAQAVARTGREQVPPDATVVRQRLEAFLS